MKEKEKELILKEVKKLFDNADLIIIYHDKKRYAWAYDLREIKRLSPGLSKRVINNFTNVVYFFSQNNKYIELKVNNRAFFIDDVFQELYTLYTMLN